MTSRPDERASQTSGPLALGDAILFQLALRGPVRIEHLVAATGADGSAVAAELARMEQGDLASGHDIAGTRHIAATARGRERAAVVIAAEGDALRPAVAAIDQRFAALNRAVKQIMLRWQVRVDRTTEVLNDHGDARYDRQVLADLRALHADVEPLLAQLAPLRPRYASLRRRLADAVSRASAGERDAVAGLTVDSFHSAWWELHGDLLALLGRPRTARDA